MNFSHMFSTMLRVPQKDQNSAISSSAHHLFFIPRRSKTPTASVYLFFLKTEISATSSSKWNRTHPSFLKFFQHQNFERFFLNIAQTPFSHQWNISRLPSSMKFGIWALFHYRSITSSSPMEYLRLPLFMNFCVCVVASHKRLTFRRNRNPSHLFVKMKWSSQERRRSTESLSTCWPQATGFPEDWSSATSSSPHHLFFIPGRSRTYLKGLT